MQTRPSCPSVYRVSRHYFTQRCADLPGDDNDLISDLDMNVLANHLIIKEPDDFYHKGDLLDASDFTIIAFLLPLKLKVFIN